MATFTDNFNRADGRLTSPWTGDGGTIFHAIYSNAVGLMAGGGGHGVAVYGGAEFTGDQYAQVKLAALPASEWATGPLVKYTPNAYSGYYSFIKATNFRLSRTGTTLFEITGMTNVVGDVFRVTAAANGANLDIKAWKNGVEIGSYTDTSPLTGTRIGISDYYGGDTVARIDDFEGGDLTAANPDVTVSASGSALTSGHGAQSPSILIAI